MVSFIREYFVIIAIVIIYMLYKYSYYSSGGHEIYEKEKNEYNSKHKSEAPVKKEPEKKEEPKKEEDSENAQNNNKLGQWGEEFEDTTKIDSADSRVNYDDKSDNSTSKEQGESNSEASREETVQD